MATQKTNPPIYKSRTVYRNTNGLTKTIAKTKAYKSATGDKVVTSTKQKDTLKGILKKAGDNYKSTFKDIAGKIKSKVNPAPPVKPAPSTPTKVPTPVSSKPPRNASAVPAVGKPSQGRYMKNPPVKQDTGDGPYRMPATGPMRKGGTVKKTIKKKK